MTAAVLRTGTDVLTHLPTILLPTAMTSVFCCGKCPRLQITARHLCRTGDRTGPKGLSSTVHSSSGTETAAKVLRRRAISVLIYADSGFEGSRADFALSLLHTDLDSFGHSRRRKGCDNEGSGDKRSGRDRGRDHVFGVDGIWASGFRNRVWVVGNGKYVGFRKCTPFYTAISR